MPRILIALLVALPLFANDITVTLEPVARPETARVLVIEGVVTSNTDTDIEDVKLLAWQPSGLTTLAGQSDDVWSCRDAGTLQKVQCVAAVLPAKSSVPVTFYLDALHGRFRVHASATFRRDGIEHASNVAESAGWFPWDIRVTHDGDSGDGSLRNAIRLANEDCEGRRLPCRIVFDAPMRILPRTPLPVIFANDLVIDGRGEVTVDGSQVSGGSGLEIDGDFASGEIRALGIRAFPWDGVHIARGTFVLDGNTIEANGSRGVFAEVPVGVYRNVIRHHGRSGVFAAGYGAMIEDNLIEENGASGVFIGSDWSMVLRNRIRNNAHFGVAVPRHVGKVHVNQNSMSGNRIAGIDRGLDGSDGDRFDDVATHAAFIPPPRLVSATYDAASNTTVIRGTYFDERDHWGTFEIELFSTTRNDPQGETFLGRTVAHGGAFVFAAEGDLRGKFITATGHRRLWLGWSGDFWWPSEFSATVSVE